MKPEARMVCSRATDADLVTRDSVYSYRCSFCNARVVISGSSDQLLKRDPDIKLCCDVCFRKLDYTPDEYLLSASPEQVAADMRNAVPNFWKKRN